MTAFITSMAYVSPDRVRDLSRHLATLTIQPPQDYGNNRLEDDVFVEPLKLYNRTKSGLIGFPRAYAKKHLTYIDFEDRTAWPSPRRRFYANTITPRNEHQHNFMSELLAIANKPGAQDILANARTGSGKLVSDLWLSARLGVPTLVVVHINNLKGQWRGDAIEKKQGLRYFFGNEFVDKYVGLAQQDVCDFKDKLFVIGLLPSLARRNYGKEFYRYFGKVTFDEVHKAAAPLMSSVLMKFPARVRVGYTATNRSDALKAVIDAHLGPPAVVSKQEVEKPNVFVHSFRGEFTLDAFNERVLVSSLAKLAPRNAYLTSLIVNGYRRGRHILVLSDRTDQLRALRRRLVDAGVPKTQVGLHAGRYKTGFFASTVTFEARLPVQDLAFKKFRMKVNDSFNSTVDARNAGLSLPYPPRLADYLRKHGFGADDVFDLEAHEYIVREVSVSEETYAPSKAALSGMRERCRILLATYGIFDTGVDEPRLDMGVEATPRGNVIQAIGRILRSMPGKPTPEWHGIEDAIYAPSTKKDGTWKPAPNRFRYVRMLEGLSLGRRKSYIAQGANIVERVHECNRLQTPSD